MKKISKAIKKVNWFQFLFNAYVVLFAFTMVNREFEFFGFDLRYALLPLGGLILLLSIIFKKYKDGVEKNDGVGKALILFYAFILIANIAWLWNGLEKHQPHLNNEIILLVNTFMSVLIFFLNRRRINFYVLNYAVMASCLVLVFSIVMVHQGFSLAEISGDKSASFSYGSTDLVNNTNAFGEIERISGYAADPNYATILLLIGIVCALKVIKRNWIKAIIVGTFVIAIGFSFSRTIVAVSIPCMIYVWLLKISKARSGTKMFLNRLFVFAILAIVITVPFLTDLTSNLPVTLTLRFSMWRRASELFCISPLIGSGLTSFRSFFYVDGWYVQAHSTYWQTISEFGIIGIILYIRIVIKSLDKSMNSPLDYFLTLVFVIWITTCETIVLPFSIFVYYLATIRPPEDEKKIVQKKRVLFFVNTLRQGGAEKVCVNLCQELLNEGKGVDFVLLNHESDTFSKEDVKILNLNINSKNKIVKILKTMFAIPRTNYWLQARTYDCGMYEMISSHLPMSNLIARFSVFSKETLYVFHSKVAAYKFGTGKMYRKIIRWFFRRRKVITVSKGLKDEYVNVYGAKKEMVHAIYNPIDSKEIAELANEKIGYDEKFILHVGRFSEAKNQWRMLNIFNNGKFYEKYKLVFCGSGENEKKIKDSVKKMNLTDSVVFMGYQENVYAWMRNAEVVVSTSDWEAFPMNLVEAFAASAKVVSSDCDYGPREILLGNYMKYLVKPKDDIEQYVRKIKEAIKNYPREVNPILEECKPSIVIRQYKDFYDE